MNVADITDLFDYTEWANGRTIAAAEKLPESELLRDFGISHRSIFETLLHMAGAEWIWLERWNGNSPAKAEAWPRWSREACTDIAQLRERWADVIARRSQFASELDAAKLETELSFKLLNGDPSSMRLGHQMQHVVNHATMHRGQVVGMIRQLGHEPPSTDLLFFLRSEISPK
jgi:uncharacterized damage-inducible protein DinB